MIKKNKKKLKFIQDHVHPDDQTQPTFKLFCYKVLSTEN